MDDKDEEFPHPADRTMTASTFKTARRVRIPSYCEFATHRVGDDPEARYALFKRLVNLAREVAQDAGGQGPMTCSSQ